MHRTTWANSFTLGNSAPTWREGIEALHYGIAELGIEIPVRENYFGPDATPIVFGAHHLSEGGERKLPADAILYNFEQLREGYPWFQARYLALLRRFRVWDYSIRNIEYLRRSNTSPGARHIPVGCVPQLSRVESIAQDIDVLFFGRSTDRRKCVLDGLIESCARLVRNPDARQTLADAGYKIITSPSRRMSAILGMLTELQNRVAGRTN
jgi:hypothetical protein